MEINKEQLRRSLDLFSQNDFKSELDKIYNSIPVGDCNGCANCCMEAVSAFYSEFLNIYKYLNSMNLLEEVYVNVESHYMNELIKKDYCPFLNDSKQCIIYPVRPLVCRLFGHSSREDHESNYDQVLEMNRSADTYFYENYGIHLSEEVINQKIEYCEDFKIDRKMTVEEKNSLVDKMFQLDTLFLIEDLIPEDAINLSITNWFMYLKYNEDEASEKRIGNLIKHNK